MQTAAVIQHYHTAPGTSLTYFGDLTLSQSSALPCSTDKIFDIYNQPVIKHEEYHLKNLFTEEYFTRNSKLSHNLKKKNI